ncbi:MAG: thiamine pyrophosphate-binding protein [Deltaproteobacteria bacterium]|nr:thiamine pyrophosphate-binding protein [Deltaproteobacteria bacterium]
MDGGSRVAEVLRAQGVELLFTLCGGHISPILVAAKRRGIRVVDTRHEVNAVFAADAVARMTGVPGVAAVTAGPGVANALTAIKNAQMAQSPIVLLGGATATMLRGRGSLQDIDQISMIAPHVKFHARPNTLREVVPALEEAFEHAKEGVPGPVFVELAVDLLYEEKTIREWYKNKTDKPNKTPAEHAMALYIRGHLGYLFFGSESPLIGPKKLVAPRAPSASDVQKAVRMIADAKRPIALVGSQAMLHPNELKDLVDAIERIGAPVYLSGMARGLLGESHRLQMRHKRREALKESDVVILCGVPADFRLDYGSHLSRADVIAVNLDEHDLTKNRRPELGVLADPHEFLTALARVVAKPIPLEGWLEKLRARDAEREAEIDELAAEPSELTNPLDVTRKLDRHLDKNSILIGDGGDFVATASYSLRPRAPLSWLDPGVFGTLGVGAGFALGAKLVNPSADVWILYGDGAVGFSITEMDTFVRHKVPVIAVVGNDGGWTQIERDQVVILGDDVGCRLNRTAYEKVAEGFGAKGVRIERPEEIEPGLQKALELSRAGDPVLVNVMLGKSEFRKGSISI